MQYINKTSGKIKNNHGKWTLPNGLQLAGYLSTQSLETRMAMQEYEYTIVNSETPSENIWDDSTGICKITNVTPSLESLKIQKMQEMASERYNEEVSGHEINGMRIPTDRES